MTTLAIIALWFVAAFAVCALRLSQALRTTEDQQHAIFVRGAREYIGLTALMLLGVAWSVLVRIV